MVLRLSGGVLKKSALNGHPSIKCQNIQNLVPWDQKNLLKISYANLIRYHEAILWSFDAKKVFGAKQVGKIQIPDFTLSVGQINQIDFV